MLYYFDSSAAAKRYTQETGSDWIKQIVEAEDEHTICFSQIAVIEIAAAMSKKLRTKEIDRETYNSALALFLKDVADESYLIAPITNATVDVAVDLTQRHPLRGYDAAHLATAIILNKATAESDNPPLVFVSADALLCKAAKEENLAVENPNEH